MIPHERSLVEKYRNDPFAIVGVNSDVDRDRIRAVVKEKGITWRSFWDGGTDGPIATRWNIRGWPTVLLIDAGGVIRTRDPAGPEALEREIEKLIEAARAAAKPGGAGETPPPSGTGS